jgi:hypothetical protein
MKKWLSRSLILVLLLITVLIPTVFVSALHAVVMEDVSANMADISVGRTFQRDTFWGAGRAWVFYMGYDPLNASHIYYRSSADGVNWATRTLFCDVTNADQFSLYWDGVYVHTVWVCNDAMQPGVSYRRGTPNSNGTITWVATQEVQIPSIVDGYMLPTITAYGGRPYLAYGYMVGPTSLWSAESSNVTTGAWSPDVVFENLDITAGNFTATACIDAFPASGIINVTVENVIAPAVTQEVGAYMYWAGAWAPYETIDSAGTPSELFSTIAWGDYLNVIFVRSAPAWHTYHRQSAIGGIWAVAPPPIEICDGSYQIASLSLWDDANGDLKCFFADNGGANNIAWKMYDNALATWDVGYFELVTVNACDRLQSSVSHASPLGVVYEDFLMPDIDSVYYDWLDSFPPTPIAPINYVAAFGSWLFILIAVIVLATVAIILSALSGGNMIENTMHILVVGVIIALAILLIMTIVD